MHSAPTCIMMPRSCSLLLMSCSAAVISSIMAVESAIDFSSSSRAVSGGGYRPAPCQPTVAVAFSIWMAAVSHD